MGKRKRDETPTRTQVKFQKRKKPVKLLEPRKTEQANAKIRKLKDENKNLKTELRQKKKQNEKHEKNLRDQAKEISALQSSMKEMKITLENNKRRNSRAESRNDVENVKEKAIKLNYYFVHPFLASVKEHYDLAQKLLAAVLGLANLNQIEPLFEDIPESEGHCRICWQVDFKDKHVNWQMLGSDSLLEKLLTEEICQQSMSDLRQCLVNDVTIKVPSNPKDVEKIKELQDVIEMTEEKVKEVSAMEAKIAELKKDKGYLTEERDDLHDRVDLMEEDQRAKETLEIELETLQEELSDTNVRLLELEDKEKECAKLRLQNEELVREHQSALDAEIKQKENLRDEICNLQAKMGDMEKVGRIQQLDEKVKRAQAQVEMLEGKLSTASFSLAQEQEDHELLKSKHVQLKQRMDELNFSELQSTLTKLRANNERLQTEASAREICVQGQSDQIREMKENLQDSSTRLSECETQKMLVEQRVESYLRSESSTKEKIDSLQEKVSDAALMTRCLDLSCVCGVYRGPSAKDMPVFPDEETFADAMNVIDKRCRVCMALLSSQDTFELREIRDDTESTLMCKLASEAKLEELSFTLGFYSADIALALEDMPSHFFFRAVQANQIQVVSVVLDKWKEQNMREYYDQYFGVVYDRGGGVEPRRSLASIAVEMRHPEMVKMLIEFEPKSLEDAMLKAKDLKYSEIAAFLEKEALRLKQETKESIA